jgi:hypothetical protein
MNLYSYTPPFFSLHINTFIKPRSCTIHRHELLLERIMGNKKTKEINLICVKRQEKSQLNC